MSTTRTRTHSTYTLEIDDHTFPIPFNDEYGTIDQTAELHVSTDGKRAIIAVLCSDDIGTDNFEVAEQGTFVHFCRSYRDNSERPDIEHFKRIIRDNPGRVVCHDGIEDCHGPGTVYTRATSHPLTVADTKGDPCPAEQHLDNCYGYYIVPEDAADPAEYAASMFRVYSAWANGEVYGVIVWQFTREPASYGLDGQPDSDEFTDWELDAWTGDDPRNECWGYIGSEYAKQQLADESADLIAALDAPRPEPGDTRQPELPS